MLLALGLVACGHQDATLHKILDDRAEALIHEATNDEAENSEEVFKRFAQLVAQELVNAGDESTAKSIVQWLSDKTADKALPKVEFAWIIHTFAREYYQQDIIEATSRLIQFRTFATDVPNRKNPEFIRQKMYLQKLSSKLDLNFRDVDGYIQEIWIGEGDKSTGFMVHSDVQPVDPSAWQVDPWSGEVKADTLWGRGAIDDKGPLAAIMYGMRAILDSGLPLKNKLILLVGTDEESRNEDVKTYLQNNVAPTRTLVVDYSYPVICAEKGWCGLWLKLPRNISATPRDGFWLTDLQGGFSPSIVPGKATATLQPHSGNIEDAVSYLRIRIHEFQQIRPGSNITLEYSGNEIRLRALGKTVHASVPETGHNALMDLLVFIDRFVKPSPNEIALLAKFGATNIGFELTGETLGISHHDDFMDEVTVAGNMFETAADSVMFMFNFRIPKGISTTQIEYEINSRIASFSDEHGVRFSEKWYLSEAHYKDPNSSFVKEVLAVYNRVTGENHQAESIGGGTYARRIPNAVVFGPTLPGDEYLGHQPNEHIKLSTLVKNIEILTHSLVEFGL
ncbi:Sapep family Mn(2+)-dependent dipeptidase [Caldithrix abyssi]|nr:Sapep family Mn(2+)-dependent dipeptidase [Caldithrix abyssi]